MSFTTFGKGVPYGYVRYFLADRCFNTHSLRQFNRNMIAAEELVTIDCALVDSIEIEIEQATEPLDGEHQYLAVIIRPDMAPDDILSHHSDFVFCGYDLVDEPCGISVITNCAAGFENAIDYAALNQYGLISDYREAVKSQWALADKYPEESHSWCEVAEIWRKTREDMQ